MVRPSVMSSFDWPRAIDPIFVRVRSRVSIGTDPARDHRYFLLCNGDADIFVQRTLEAEGRVLGHGGLAGNQTDHVIQPLFFVQSAEQFHGR